MMTVRWMVALSMMLASTVAQGTGLPDEQAIQDADGTTFAVLTLCNDCRSGAGTNCHTGAEEGWFDGKPCGKCLLDSNFAESLTYPYDLHVTGTLVDSEGAPVKNRFVKAFLSNGWSVRTKTSDVGMFRLMLGATAERKGREPLVTDIGTRVDTQKGTDPFYALFLLPPSYKPCAADAMRPPTPRAKGAAPAKAKPKQ